MTTSALQAPAFTAVLVALATLAAPAQANDNLDAQTAASGLKEALEVGTGKAVDLLGQIDGYWGNPDVRIPVPEQLDFLTKTLKMVGQQDLVDEFEVSMNRAAEAAAPLAREVFVNTIKEMTFSDALEIVRGNDHEATDYLRANAGGTLSERFRPIVDDQLNGVGATQQFNKMMDATTSLPLVSKPAFDLGQFVTDKSLDGMFLLIAREEKKIREDPLARTSDLLKQVFGGDSAPSLWKRLFGRD